MRPLRRRTSIVATMFVLVVFAQVVVGAGSAEACSCAVPVLDERVEASDLVFVGTQIDRLVGVTDVLLVFEINEVYKGAPGSPGDIIELRTGHGGGDCGTSAENLGPVGVTASPSPDGGRPSVGICGSFWPANHVRFTFNPLPEPAGSGTPAFYTSMDVGGSRGVLISDIGEVVGYGMGSGDLVASAFCPESRALIEVAVADRSTVGNPGEPPPQLVVRSVPQMEIVSTTPIDYPGHPDESRNVDWLADLACHAPDASDISFALVKYRYEPLPAAHVADDATFYRIRPSDTSTLSLGDARSHTVDIDTDRIFAITSETGQMIKSWRLSDLTELEEMRLPNSDVGWDLAVSNGTLGVLARDSLPSEENWYWWDVDRIDTFTKDLLPVQTFEFGRHGSMKAFDATDTTFRAIIETLTNDLEPDGVFLMEADHDGSVRELMILDRYRGGVANAAIGATSFAATSYITESFEVAAYTDVNASVKPEYAEALGPIAAADGTGEAIVGTVVEVGEAGSTTSTAAPTTTTTIPASTTTEGVALPEGPADGSTTPWTLIVAILAGMLVVVAGLVAFTRRRN